MSDFVNFRGRFDKTREVPEDESSGLRYRNNDGKFIILTRNEFAELTKYYQAYIAKWLWLRERAATHWRYVQEPTLKRMMLQRRCNSYRDTARAEAFKIAYDMLLKNRFLQEMTLRMEDQFDGKNYGPDATRAILTERGNAWFKNYRDWYADEFRKPFCTEPERDQFVDENGYDKDESTAKHPVIAPTDWIRR